MKDEFWKLNYGLFLKLPLVAFTLIIYLYGFMDITGPVSSKNIEHINYKNSKPTDDKDIISDQTVLPVEKLVVIVIDALRSDHLAVDNNTSMKYSRELVKNGSAFSYIIQTAAPTVTMPRIKSLLSGTMPAFIDIIFNFASSIFKEDNIIKLWIDRGYRIHFYGDETWLKLFPNAFHQWDAVTSFFVADYIEVDENVTRHLNADLREPKWDVLILHYLGLDHIGHLEGPKSRLVSPKLNEMDDILKKIYQALDNKQQSYAILLCGDHGMGDAGGHGGSSLSEIMSSGLLVSSLFKSNEKSHFSNAKMVRQVDLASTLSILSGTKIPERNIGMPFSDIFNFIPLFEQFYIHEKVTAQLFNLASNYKDNAELERIFEKCYEGFNRKDEFLLLMSEGYHRNAKEIIQLYINCQSDLSSFLLEKSHSYDIFLILASTLTLIMAFLSFVYGGFNCNERSWNLKPVIFGSLFLLIIKFFISFYFLLFTFLLLFFFYSLLNLLHCEWRVPSSFFSAVACVDFCIKMVSYFHPILLMSSSYVEEEHFIFYFIISIIYFVIFIKYVIRSIRDNLSMLQICKDLLLILISWFCFRFMRSCNATGDKWKHLIDINDLIRDSSPDVVKLTILVGLILTYYLFYSKNLVLSFITLIFIYLRHSFSKENPSHGNSQALLAYLFIFIIFLKNVFTSCFNLKFKESSTKIYQREIFNSFIVCFSLLFLLLQRPENILLSSLSFLHSYLFIPILIKEFQMGPSTVIAFWLSSSHYFIQGNSNSLTTVKVDSGFVGISFYQPIIHGILIVVHTFGSKILVLLNFIFLASYSKSAKCESILMKWCELQLFILSVYVCNVTFHRHHLFIWSVFAPKLLYEACHLLVLIFIILICYCVGFTTPLES